MHKLWVIAGQFAEILARVAKATKARAVGPAARASAAAI